MTHSGMNIRPPHRTLQMPLAQWPGLLSAVVQMPVKATGSQVSLVVLQVTHGPLQFEPGSQVTCSPQKHAAGPESCASLSLSASINRDRSTAHG